MFIVTNLFPKMRLGSLSNIYIVIVLPNTFGTDLNPSVYALRSGRNGGI
jgi:hypothetical protein